MHVIAAKAVAFKEALTPAFKEYQQQVVVNADVLAKTMMKRGYSIVCNGTDNHLMLVSLIDKPITGKEAEEALGKANITVNKNTVPKEFRSPFVTSGLRLGTPAVTTRGFKEKECEQLGHWICDVLDDISNEKNLERVKKEVLALCREFPVYEAFLKQLSAT